MMFSNALPVAVLVCSLNGLASSTAFAQTDCGTVLTAAQAKRARALIDAGAYDLPVGAAGGQYVVPFTFHVVRRSDGTGGIWEGQLDQALEDANAAFVDSGFEFCQAAGIDYIDDDDFYYNIDTLAEINALRQTNPVANTVNIYFTPNLANQNGSFCGISSFTNSPVQCIVMHNTCTGLSWNPSTFPHEVGHYFDLYHTHETAFGVECVNGSNCDIAGDLLCDTPADPGLLQGGQYFVDPDNCQYIGNFESPCPGDPPYDPDTRNYLSSSRPLCRDHLTQHQDEKALATLLNLRPELVNSQCPGVVGDLDGDGSVGVKDLLILLGNWGLCRDCNNCPADLNGDCNVGVVDLLILLGNWG